MTPRLWLPALALGLAAATPLAAQQGPAGFEAFDIDGDGVITAEEWAAGLERLPARMADALRRLPTEGASREDIAAQRMLDRFDADGDGRLDAGELAAAMAAMADRRGMDADAPRRGDNRRTEDRGARWGDQGGARGNDRGADRAHAEGPRWGSFQRLDADGDGVISRAEWQAARDRASDRGGDRPGDRGDMRSERREQRGDDRRENRRSGERGQQRDGTSADRPGGQRSGEGMGSGQGMGQGSGMSQGSGQGSGMGSGTGMGAGTGRGVGDGAGQRGGSGAAAD